MGRLEATAPDPLVQPEFRSKGQERIPTRLARQQHAVVASSSEVILDPCCLGRINVCTMVRVRLDFISAIFRVWSQPKYPTHEAPRSTTLRRTFLDCVLRRQKMQRVKVLGHCARGTLNTTHDTLMKDSVLRTNRILLPQSALLGCSDPGQRICAHQSRSKPWL